MRPAPAGHTTKSDFADKHLRCARSLVSKYAKAGRLVLDESGKFVHVEQSMARIRETMGAPQRGKREVLAAQQQQQQQAAPDTAAPILIDSRDRREFYEAEKSRLDYEQRCGQLMEAGRVVHAITGAAVTLRTALEEVAAQIAPRLPVSREAQEQCRLLLAEHIEVLLTQLSGAFNQAAVGANA
jgi:hypothetical protein